MSGLDAIFDAGSIAVVGASADERKYAGKLQSALVRHGFEGELVLINPKYESLFGRPCYPSLAAAPDVDLAVLAVRSQDVLAQLEAAASKGARGAIVVSAGFAEMGAQGRQLQAEIRRFASRTGVRVLGPNCQGAYRVASGVCTSFATPFLVGEPIVTPGPLAWVSQSGAVGGAAVTTLLEQGFRLAYYVSTGNEADLHMAEILSHVVEDPAVEIVCGYLEELKDGPLLATVARRAGELGKPVIMIRGGGTEAGAEATRLHTGALAHHPGVLEQFLRQCGVVVVQDLEELTAAATVHASGGEPPGGARVAIVGNSGGLNAILADSCERHGFELERPEGVFLKAVEDNVPSFIAPGNPIDLAQAAGLDAAVVGRLVRGIGASVDWVFVCLYSVHSELGYRYDVLFGELAEAVAETSTRVGLVFYGCDPAAVSHARGLGLAVFPGIATMLSTVSRCRATAVARSGGGWQPVPASVPAGAAGTHLLNEQVMKDRLSSAGLAVPGGRTVTTDEAALEIANSVGYPVVAKLVSDHVVHKAAAGALETGIGDDRQLRAALARLRAVAAALPAVEPAPAVLVEQQVPFDVEVMAGFKRVPNLGVMMIAGAGGSRVEIDQDVASAFAPLAPGDVERLIRRTGLGPRLAGDEQAAKSLVGMLTGLQDFFVAQPDLLEMDVNPIGLRLASGQAVVLDAVAVAAPSRQDRRGGRT